MANALLSALGPGGALGLRDEGHTPNQDSRVLDRIQIERLDFELVGS